MVMLLIKAIHSFITLFGAQDIGSALAWKTVKQLSLKTPSTKGVDWLKNKVWNWLMDPVPDLHYVIPSLS